MSYTYSKKIDLQFEDAVEKTRKLLERENFGILTEIDLKEIFRKKLNLEYGNYVIMGVCNPFFAHEALKLEKEVGLLLPCKIIIFENDGSVQISAILPSVMMSIVENPELSKKLRTVENSLKRVIDGL